MYYYIWRIWCISKHTQTILGLLSVLCECISWFLSETTIVFVWTFGQQALIGGNNWPVNGGHCWQGSHFRSFWTNDTLTSVCQVLTLYSCKFKKTHSSKPYPTGEIVAGEQSATYFFEKKRSRILYFTSLWSYLICSGGNACVIHILTMIPLPK